MGPVETYAKVILHSGCALIAEPHKWEQCPAKHIYMRRARKHQHRLKSNGLAIGYWIKETDIEKLRTRLSIVEGQAYNEAIDDVLKVIKNDE